MYILYITCPTHYSVFDFRSQWPRGLGHELSSPSPTLRSCVRIPLEAWMSVCVYSMFVLSCVQLAAFRRADPPSKESYLLLGSNPTEGVVVCVHLFRVCVVLCVGSSLATGWSPSKESYLLLGSNHTRGINVCVRLFRVCVVLCVDSGFATGWSPVQGVLPTVYRIRTTEKETKSQQMGCRA
jgi:hypothetical protein